MIYCPFCGTQNSQSARFCQNCGSLIPRRGRDSKFLLLLIPLALVLLAGAGAAVWLLLQPGQTDNTGAQIFPTSPQNNGGQSGGSAALVTSTFVPLPTRTLAPSLTPALPTRAPTRVLTRTPTRTPTPSPCQRYTGQLRIGLVVEVSRNPGLPNRVRAKPGLDGDYLGQIKPGEQADVLRGPSCKDGFVWWYVRSRKNTALEGWTAEGEGSQKWLLPVRQ